MQHPQAKNPSRATTFSDYLSSLKFFLSAYYLSMDYPWNQGKIARGRIFAFVTKLYAKNNLRRDPNNRHRWSRITVLAIPLPRSKTSGCGCAFCNSNRMRVRMRVDRFAIGSKSGNCGRLVIKGLS